MYGYIMTKVSVSLYLSEGGGGGGHICVGKLTTIGSDNGLSPGRRQAIIWTNAGILSIGPLGTNFSEILIAIQTFSFTKMHSQMPSVKWRPFCLGLNVLKLWIFVMMKMLKLVFSPCEYCQPHRMGHGQHLNLNWIWMVNIVLKWKCQLCYSLVAANGTRLSAPLIITVSAGTTRILHIILKQNFIEALTKNNSWIIFLSRFFKNPPKCQLILALSKALCWKKM